MSDLWQTPAEVALRRRIMELERENASLRDELGRRTPVTISLTDLTPTAIALAGDAVTLRLFAGWDLARDPRSFAYHAYGYTKDKNGDGYKFRYYIDANLEIHRQRHIDYLCDLHRRMIEQLATDWAKEEAAHQPIAVRP